MIIGEYSMSPKSITLPIHGMTCIGCVAHIQGALEDVPGVIEVDVNLATGEAKLLVVESPSILESIKDAVTKAGYKPL